MVVVAVYDVLFSADVFLELSPSTVVEPGWLLSPWRNALGTLTPFVPPVLHL